jgi:hypothetical protein
VKKIAIAGPGRSGTSFLVSLLNAWGLSTPDGDSSWNETAQAGLEHRLGRKSPFDVDKDPWAFNYLDRLTDDELAQYSVLIVPIRDLRHAAVSRSVQERFSRMSSGDLDAWAWDTYGTVAGGAVFDTSVSGIQEVLREGLWHLLEVASKRGLPIVILNFPRIVSDFDYLWSQVGPFVGERTTEVEALAAWQAIAKMDKVRIGDTPVSMEPDELQALVRMQISQMDKVSRERDEVLMQRDAAQAERDAAQAERDAAQAERDAAQAELSAMKASRSWRYTRTLRGLRSRL